MLPSYKAENSKQISREIIQKLITLPLSSSADFKKYLLLLIDSQEIIFKTSPSNSDKQAAFELITFLSQNLSNPPIIKFRLSSLLPSPSIACHTSSPFDSNKQNCLYRSLPFNSSNGRTHSSSVISIYNGNQVEEWKQKDWEFGREFSNEAPFTDPFGFFELSDSLLRSFFAWKRPWEIFDKEEKVWINCRPNQNTIKQTQVGDCSFISSLIVLSDYQQRTSISVLSNSLFPSVPNPLGKYKVRLFLNGAWRKIEIDDFFPVDQNKKMLCSKNVDKGDLFIPLIEKAYIKLNKGYAFPGSTSSTDIFRLLKWIPEFIRLSTSKESLWNKMLRIYEDGLGVMVAGTGSNSLILAEEHAFAILFCGEGGIDKNGKKFKLMVLRNPWRESKIDHKYFFENFERLPPQLKKILNELQKGEDKGVFVMEFNSFCSAFEDLHISWNPEKVFIPMKMFNQITRKNTFTNYLVDGKLKKNPQFCIYDFQPSKIPKFILWILLSQHSENNIFDEKSSMNLLIFWTTEKFLDKLDNSYNPLHYRRLEKIKYTKVGFALAKIDLSEEFQNIDKIENFKLIILPIYFGNNQIKKEEEVHYSLNLYSNIEYKIAEIEEFKSCTEIVGSLFNGGFCKYNLILKNERKKSTILRIEVEKGKVICQLKNKHGELINENENGMVLLIFSFFLNKILKLSENLKWSYFLENGCEDMETYELTIRMEKKDEKKCDFKINFTTDSLMKAFQIIADN